MAKAIGPNFGNEIAAAGLLGLEFSWDPSGSIHYGGAVTAQQTAQVAAVYAAHDPARPDPIAESAKLVAAGVAITSAGTPALNGTYGCSQQDEINITGLQVALGVGSFPGFMRDKTGTAHAMTGPQFTAVAEAVLGFMVAIDQAKAAALGGAAWVPPAAVVNLP